METERHVLDRQDADVERQPHVERAQHVLDRQGAGEIDAGNLLQRVNTGVGPACTT